MKLWKCSQEHCDYVGNYRTWKKIGYVGCPRCGSVLPYQPKIIAINPDEIATNATEDEVMDLLEKLFDGRRD